MNNISSCVGGLRAILYCRCPTNTSVSFHLCFLCTYSRMYTGKILSLVEGLQAVLSSTGNRFFFQGQCAIMELCYSLWLPDHWQNAHTHTHTPSHKHAHTQNHTWAHWVAVRECDFTTSTKYSEGRSEWRDIRHSSPGDVTTFSMLLPFSTAQPSPVVPLALWISQVCCQGHMMDIEK